MTMLTVATSSRAAFVSHRNTFGRMSQHLDGSGAWLMAKASSDTATLAPSRVSFATRIHGRTTSTSHCVCSAETDIGSDRSVGGSFGRGALKTCSQFFSLQSSTLVCSSCPVFDGDRLKLKTGHSRSGRSRVPSPE